MIRRPGPARSATAAEIHTGRRERRRVGSPNADIENLRAAAVECKGCELWESATQVVFSAGNSRAPMVLVGEQPGDAEDRQGIPFVGPAGKLLQRALSEAGVAVSDV